MKPEVRGWRSEVGVRFRPAMAVAVLISLASGLWPLATFSAQPIVTDSRIKTFVYNPNEVFAVTTHYGYQSNIEFGEKETIDTVSVGDRVGWQIIPSGRRLFIRAMEENAHTNMTIVTNQHAYQFDLRSSASDAVFGSEELTYVVRFYYPDPNAHANVAASAADFTPQAPALVNTPSAPAPMAYMPPRAPAYAPPSAGYAQQPTGYAPPLPPQQQPMGYAYAPTPSYQTPSMGQAPNAQLAPRATVPTVAVAAPVAPARATYNYRYTYSGASEVAPTKIYDDGVTTYFRLPSASVPRVAILTTKGEQIEVPTRQLPNNIVAVDVIAQSFSISDPSGQVTVYNESGGV